MDTRALLAEARRSTGAVRALACPSTPAATRRAQFLVAGGTAGVLIRLLLLPYRGTNDMSVYAGWGKSVLDIGLSRAYVGGYFPLQYQLFAGEVRLASYLHLSVVSSIKLVNLLTDACAFVTFVALLRRLGRNPLWALLYWLSPYFLSIYWLGYVDSQLALCVLLSLFILAGGATPRRAMAASLPFGVAFLMKPQAISLFAIVVLLFIASMLVARRVTWVHARLGLLLCGPVALFCAYSLYFWRQGWPIAHLETSYTPGTLDNLSRGLTMNMLNIWLPVAHHYLKPGEPLYAVEGPAIYHRIGAVLVALSMIGAALLVATRLRRASLVRLLVMAWAFATLLLPMLGTRAHENHLFLGLSLGVLLIALHPSRTAIVAVHGMLLVQFLNEFGRYGFGLNHLSRGGWVHGIEAFYRSDVVQLAASYTMIAFFAVLLVDLVRSIDCFGDAEAVLTR